MNEEQKSAIFGLNFMQADHIESAYLITGTYDPEQELWVTQGNVEASPAPSRTNKTIGTHFRSTRATFSGAGMDMDPVTLPDTERIRD